VSATEGQFTTHSFKSRSYISERATCSRWGGSGAGGKGRCEQDPSWPFHMGEMGQGGHATCVLAGSPNLVAAHTGLTTCPNKPKIATVLKVRKGGFIMLHEQTTGRGRVST
jgi:hypothetical protein